MPYETFLSYEHFESQDLNENDNISPIDPLNQSENNTNPSANGSVVTVVTSNPSSSSYQISQTSESSDAPWYIIIISVVVWIFFIWWNPFNWRLFGAFRHLFGLSNESSTSNNMCTPYINELKTLL